MLLAVEKPESMFDIESEIKIIKRFQLSQPDDDTQITFLGAEPYNQTKSTDGDSDSGLCTTATLNASADMPAQSDPLGHLHEELRILNNKIDQLESREQKSGVDIMANAQGEKPPAQDLMNVEQAPPVSEESALVLHALVEKSSEENTSEKIVSDDEP
ncbi:hypothetical protein Tco_1535979, partial [Tanacetum coccineum]